MKHSEIILQLMEEKGITAYKISKETGISVSLFSKWKKNPTSEISSNKLCLIADYLNVSIDELIGRKPRTIQNNCCNQKQA